MEDDILPKVFKTGTCYGKTNCLIFCLGHECYEYWGSWILYVILLLL